MIQYFIYKTEEKINTVFPEKDPEITDVKMGKINLQNLSQSSAEKEIFEIPKENQIELNEKGETAFTIITKTIVTLNLV